MSEIDLESFIKLQVNEIKAKIKVEEDLFKERNKVHFDKIEALRKQAQPFEKLLRDYEFAKKGITPPIMGRKPVAK